MKIPKQVTVGSKRYRIERPAKMRSPLLGYIHYEKRTITVARRNAWAGTPRTARQQAATFWHEITHAILKDMDHRLESNERFVEAFAQRLTTVIYTARF